MGLQTHEGFSDVALIIVGQNLEILGAVIMSIINIDMRWDQGHIRVYYYLVGAKY